MSRSWSSILVFARLHLFHAIVPYAYHIFMNLLQPRQNPASSAALVLSTICLPSSVALRMWAREAVIPRRCILGRVLLPETLLTCRSPPIQPGRSCSVKPPTTLELLGPDPRINRSSTSPASTRAINSPLMSGAPSAVSPVAPFPPPPPSSSSLPCTPPPAMNSGADSIRPGGGREQNDRELWAVADESRTSAMWKENKFGYGTFGSTRMFDAGYATVESTPIELNLGAFSG